MIGIVLQAMVRDLRQKGLTQRKISELTGVDRSTIAYMESGKHLDARFSTVAKLASGLGISLDEVVSRGAPSDLEPARALSVSPIYELVNQILRSLAEYYPEEAYSGCHLCLQGMCRHDTGIQFARMLREACYRLARSRGWRYEG